jgi:hypothetical protein
MTNPAGQQFNQEPSFHLIPHNMAAPWNMHVMQPSTTKNKVGIPYPTHTFVECMKFDSAFQQLPSTTLMHRYCAMVMEMCHPISDLFGITLTVVKQMFVGGSHGYGVNSLIRRLTITNTNDPPVPGQPSTFIYDKEILQLGIDPFLLRESMQESIYLTNGTDPANFTPPTIGENWVIGHNKIITILQLQPIKLQTFMQRQALKNNIIINTVQACLQKLQIICHSNALDKLWLCCKYAHQRLRHLIPSLFVLAIELFCTILMHLHGIWDSTYMNGNDPGQTKPTASSKPPTPDPKVDPIMYDLIPSNNIAHAPSFDYNFTEQIKVFQDTQLLRGVLRHQILSSTIARLLRQLTNTYNTINFLTSASLTSLITEHNHNTTFTNQQINNNIPSAVQEVIPAYISKIADITWETARPTAITSTQLLVNSTCLQLLIDGDLVLPHVTEKWGLRLQADANTCDKIYRRKEEIKRSSGPIQTPTPPSDPPIPITNVSSNALYLLQQLEETSSTLFPNSGAGNCGFSAISSPTFIYTPTLIQHPTTGNNNQTTITPPVTGTLINSSGPSHHTGSLAGTPFSTPQFSSTQNSNANQQYNSRASQVSTLITSPLCTLIHSNAFPPSTGIILSESIRTPGQEDRQYHRKETIQPPRQQQQQPSPRPAPLPRRRVRTTKPSTYHFLPEEEAISVPQQVTSTASVQQVNKLSPNTTAQLTQGITNLGVNNISTYAATEDELHILALGENFIFEPKDITDIEIWDAFDDFADTLSFKESDFFHSKQHDKNSVLSRLRAKLFSKKQQARQSTYNRVNTAARCSEQSEQNNVQSVYNMSHDYGNNTSTTNNTNPSIPDRPYRNSSSTNSTQNSTNNKLKFPSDQPETNEYLCKVKKALTESLGSRPKPPIHRLSQAESKDIQAILYSLKHNQLIVIKPADKNLGLTIMDRK